MPENMRTEKTERVTPDKDSTDAPERVSEHPSNGNSEAEDHIEESVNKVEEKSGKARLTRPIILFLSVVGLATIIFVSLYLTMWSSAQETGGKVDEDAGTSVNNPVSGNEVKLESEALNSSGIEIGSVTQRSAVATFRVPGTVEANPEKTQAVTPLVSGSVSQVRVSIGDQVRVGQEMAVLVSTEIAELYGRFREAESRYELAKENLARVTRAENRKEILKAKAELDEAEATLNRTRRLIDLGAGAGKDLIAAETRFKTAKAEYEFQRNISLNKEIQEAEAEVRTATVEVNHLRRSLQAFGVTAQELESSSVSIARVPVRAPISGLVTSRSISVGSGVQAGQQLFTVSDISTVWITAHVPQQQLGTIRPGSYADIKLPTDEQSLLARVSYVDPEVNKDTRTARVRLPLKNSNARMKVGMYVEVGFKTGPGGKAQIDLVVPSGAVQQIDERHVVFVPDRMRPGVFAVREIETGSTIDGYRQVLSGLKLGEEVVTKGSFILKSQLLKGELGDE